MRLTADHAEIRGWIEAHGGRPAVEPWGDGHERLAIRFELGHCQPLPWDEFFERFDRAGLAFAYDPEANGDGIATAKLVSR